MIRKLSVFTAACLMVVLACPALALEVPGRPDGYVTDRAGLLSAAAKSKITRGLSRFESATTHQILVAVFPSIEDRSLEDFSIRLAEKWKPGQAGQDNGVILLIFPEDKLLRIEVGYGLEGVLPDALCGQIIQNVISPKFKTGDMDGGVLAGLQAILSAIDPSRTGEGGVSQTYTQHAAQRALTPEEIAQMKKQARTTGYIILMLVAGIFIFDLFRYRTYRNSHAGSHGYGFTEWFIRFAVLMFLLSMILRLMFYAMLFSRGGYSGGRGGGFSAGGGSFGGGGASGRW